MRRGEPRPPSVCHAERQAEEGDHDTILVHRSDGGGKDVQTAGELFDPG